MRTLWVLALVPALACGARDRGRGERTRQLAGCTDALEKAGAAPPGEQAEVLARGCAAVCPGLEAWLTARGAIALRPGVMEAPADGATPMVALVDGCHPDCDVVGATGRVPPPMRWPALLDACTADGLGLPREQAALASEEGVVLADVSRWLDRIAHTRIDDPQLPARLEHVSLASTFALPLPVHPGLPDARFRAASGARQFVVIEDELRVGAVPHVRLRGGRLEALAVPGAYPGQRVELDQLGGVLAQHAEVLAQMGAPAVATPLVITDRATPVSRVLDVVTRLGVNDAEVGVAGEVTYAHPVRLERRGMNVALPEIDLGDSTITLRGFGDDRVTDWDHLDAELDNFAAVNAPIRAIELHALPGTSMADLVRILDACVVARISALEFIPGM